MDAPFVPDELAGGFREAVEHCLVHNSLRSAPDVAIEVRHVAPTGGRAPGDAALTTR